jgi:hypothetical protein
MSNLVTGRNACRSLGGPLLVNLTIFPLHMAFLAVKDLSPVVIAQTFKQLASAAY